MVTMGRTGKAKGISSCANGEKLKCLTVIDEWSRECIAIKVAGSIKSSVVVEVLKKLFAERGSPQFIRSDNGPEFIACAVQDWLATMDVSTAYIPPGKPWHNGASLQANSLTLQIKDASVVALLEETIDFFAPIAEKAEIALHLTSSAELPRVQQWLCLRETACFCVQETKPSPRGRFYATNVALSPMSLGANGRTTAARIGDCRRAIRPAPSRGHRPLSRAASASPGFSGLLVGRI